MKRFTFNCLFISSLLGSYFQPGFAQTDHFSLPPLLEDEVTIVVIPDTQFYTGNQTKRTPDSTEPVQNANLERQVKWILENQSAQRIKFVTHVGDIVDKNDLEQWTVAHAHLRALHDFVPFSLSVGNHDVKRKGNSELFQNHFGAKNFTKYDWYLGHYSGKDGEPQISGNNANSAQLVKLGDHEILHLSLECNAPDPVLDWAKGMVEKHADKEVWITTHMDLGIVSKPKNHYEHIHGEKGRMQWKKVHGDAGNTPQQLWDKFYSTVPNLRLILSGDQSRVTALRQVDTNAQGKKVHALLSDYQSQPMLRLMRFNPKTRSLKVITLDIGRQRLVDATEYVADVQQHQFELQLDGLK